MIIRPCRAPTSPCRTKTRTDFALSHKERSQSLFMCPRSLFCYFLYPDVTKMRPRTRNSLEQQTNTESSYLHKKRRTFGRSIRRRFKQDSRRERTLFAVGPARCNRGQHARTHVGGDGRKSHYQLPTHPKRTSQSSP